MEITLTAAARVRLRAAMKQTSSARLSRRLQAVWLAGEGHSATQVATITGASARSVQYWCATWRRSKAHRHPQKALAEKPRLGRHPLVPALDRDLAPPKWNRRTLTVWLALTPRLSIWLWLCGLYTAFTWHLAPGLG